MRRWFMPSTSNLRVGRHATERKTMMLEPLPGRVVSPAGWGQGSARPRARRFRGRQANLWRAVGWAVLMVSCWQAGPASAAINEKDREPITLSVVVVNPSSEKTQTVPVRIELPQEVTPKDVLEQGELTLEYDDDKALYYLYKEDVALAPKETRIFSVIVKDLWFVPQDQLASLKDYTGLLLGKLKDTEYAPSAKQLADSILQRLTDIATIQNDEALSRKARIGAYRKSLQTIDKIKEDLARMEKLMTFTGGPPVPELLEESPLKSDAPSTTTTWLVIFLIIAFMGLLGGQFFFTWQRRNRATQEFAVLKQDTFVSASRSPNGHGNGAAPNGKPAASPGARQDMPATPRR